MADDITRERFRADAMTVCDGLRKALDHTNAGAGMAALEIVVSEYLATLAMLSGMPADEVTNRLLGGIRERVGMILASHTAHPLH